jgi:hypothetical protein
MGVDDSAPFGIAELVEHLAPLNAGVVHQNIHGPAVGNDAGDTGIHPRLVGDIEGCMRGRKPGLAQLGRPGGDRTLVQVVDDHMRTGRGDRLRDLPADATRRTCHQCDAALQRKQLGRHVLLL